MILSGIVHNCVLTLFAFTASPAVEELFDMIRGLDDMMKHSNTVTSGGSANTSNTPPDSVSSSESVSLTGQEVHSLVSTPRQMVC